MKNKSIQSIIKPTVYICSFLLLLASIILLMIFIVTFRGPISKDLSVWYEWGSFLAFLVSLVNLACFLLLTYRAYLFQEDSYKKQMRAQKIELETSFRKSHIEDVREKLALLDDLPSVKFNVKESYDEFAKKCYSLIRVFSIYQDLYKDLFRDCDYSVLNDYLNNLKNILDEIENGNKDPVDEASRLETEIGKVNKAMIVLEKNLSDYTLQCVNDAF